MERLLVCADMVKNKGIMPANPAEIPVQRAQLKSIIKSTYAACTKPDPEGGRPFTAEAIIANPVAYGESKCGKTFLHCHDMCWDRDELYR